MMDDILIFDRKAVRNKRNRCANHLEKHGFLFDWCLDEIHDRLGVINHDFPTALQIGKRSKTPNKDSLGIETLHTMDIAEDLAPNIQADEELLPFKENSFDLVINSLGLHGTNDPAGNLIQIKNTLKPDGLFIGALFGGETLYELRHCLQQAEIETTGGMSPHISPFADKLQIGSLMQRAGFSIPVIDSEKITVTYDNIFKLMQDLRFMGEGNTLIKRPKNITNKQLFLKANEIYSYNFSDIDNRITATFEIIFVHGWAPHKSQQKPLRPGSAEIRMAEALQSTETKLPC